MRNIKQINSEISETLKKLNALKDEKRSLTNESPMLKTIDIGGTLWMNRNLTYDDGKEGIFIVNKEYYYTQAAAKRIAKYLGWKLPSYKDWLKLFSCCGGIKAHNRNTRFYNIYDGFIIPSIYYFKDGIKNGFKLKFKDRVVITNGRANQGNPEIISFWSSSKQCEVHFASPKSDFIENDIPYIKAGCDKAEFDEEDALLVRLIRP